MLLIYRVVVFFFFMSVARNILCIINLKIGKWFRGFGKHSVRKRFEYFERGRFIVRSSSPSAYTSNRSDAVCFSIRVNRNVLHGTTRFSLFFGTLESQENSVRPKFFEKAYKPFKTPLIFHVRVVRVYYFSISISYIYHAPPTVLPSLQPPATVKLFFFPPPATLIYNMRYARSVEFVRSFRRSVQRSLFHRNPSVIGACFNRVRPKTILYKDGVQ